MRLGQPTPLSGEAHANVQSLIVGAAADLAVVAQVELRRRGEGRGGREADGGGIALRRATTIAGSAIVPCVTADPSP
jgi:hypothetical protein